ncbi:hypothetical protein [Ottowia sp.]|uniref:hypothetical protein n=1 Tax=Ottowia sp. TaxID=1898956 RepID=UPI003A8889D8
MSATLQDAGRTALATALKAMPMHLAWGRGDPAWDTTPEAEPTDATALVAEVGRRKVTSAEYATPDAAGVILMPGGERFAVSATPTPWLYLRTVFDFAEANGETIREVALFVGGATDAALPPGQHYYTPAQVTDPGRMYLLDRGERIERTGTTYQAFEYILPL